METKKLKIAYVIPRFHPFRGGAEINMQAMASRMVKEGHDVTVITTNAKYRDEKLPLKEEYEGMHIVRNVAWNNLLYAGFYPGLLPFLLKNQFDVIHSSGIGFLWREFCLVIKKLISRKKTKFVVTPHGPFMALGDKKGFRGFARKTYTRILSLFIPWLYDKVIEINPKQEEWMVADYKIKKEKIVLVPNGIDADYPATEIFKHNKSDKVIITYMNRHEWYKGSQDIIKALDYLKNSKSLEFKFENLEFYLMGRAGNYTQKLKDLVEKLYATSYVKFIFAPSDEERDRIFYEESQISILPSKWEGTGIALLEAMAKGNVGITTVQNEANEILIKEGRTGYVFEFGDYKKLARILKKLLEDYDLRQEIRKNNIKFAKQFTWDGVFPDYKLMIEELASKNK